MGLGKDQWLAQHSGRCTWTRSFLSYGCHIGGVFFGVVGYADDLLLLAPTRDAVQNMLEICEAFTSQNNIKFITEEDPSKSKIKALYVVGPQVALSPGPSLFCSVAGLYQW